jgi:hypothetical protein
MHANEITAAVTLSVVGTSHQVDGVQSTTHCLLEDKRKKTGNGKYTPPDPPQLLRMLIVERIRFIHSIPSVSF